MSPKAAAVTGSPGVCGLPMRQSCPALGNDKGDALHIGNCCKFSFNCDWCLLCHLVAVVRYFLMYMYIYIYLKFYSLISSYMKFQCLPSVAMYANKLFPIAVEDEINKWQGKVFLSQY